MSRAAPQEKTIEELYLDCKQVMTVLKNRDHAPTMERLAYSLNALIAKLEDNNFPDVLKNEIVLKIQPYINFIAQKDPVSETLFNTECRKYLQDTADHLHRIKNNGTIQFNGNINLDKFFTSFLTPSVDEHSSRSLAPTPTTRQFYHRGSIQNLIKQLCEPEGKGGFQNALRVDLGGLGDTTYLLRSRNGYSTSGFLNNAAVLNVVQTYLIGEFNGVVLNQLLDAWYGHYDQHMQRHVISDSFSTLYPYLRFALLGPTEQMSEAVAIRQTSGALVPSDDKVDIQASSPDLLLAVLRGDDDTRHKVHPDTLVHALIGGDVEDYEFSGGLAGIVHESHNTLSPLIFHFATSEVHTQILLKNILYVEHGTGKYLNDKYDYIETKKYQTSNAPELLRLISYMRKNATTDEQRSAASSFITAAIAAVITGNDTQTLGEIYKIQDNTDSVLSIAFSETTKADDDMASSSETIVQPKSAVGFFRSNATPTTANSPDAQCNVLIQRINDRLQSLGALFNQTSSANTVNLYHQKITVLKAAKKLLCGESVDFNKIKQENPRYAEGTFSHKTRDIVVEVDNLLIARAASLTSALS